MERWREGGREGGRERGRVRERREGVRKGGCEGGKEGAHRVTKKAPPSDSIVFLIHMRALGISAAVNDRTVMSRWAWPDGGVAHWAGVGQTGGRGCDTGAGSLSRGSRTAAAASSPVWPGLPPSDPCRPHPSRATPTTCHAHPGGLTVVSCAAGSGPRTERP